jgi:hypothetical protein
MALKSQFHAPPDSHYVQAKVVQLANGPCCDPFEGDLTILIPARDVEPRDILSSL